MKIVHSPMNFPNVFMLILLFVLPNFLAITFLLTNEAYRSFTANFSFPKIAAKSDSDDNFIISDSILDQVQLDNLKETVYDLSSFYTRHTESEKIDDVASWLTEKLQNICGREVYIHNFTHAPNGENDDDDVDSQQNQHQEKLPSYHLKNIVCEKLGSTNNTIIISAHYDSRMEDIENITARAPGADDNASGVSALLEVARILSNASLQHSIIFVLFPGEEQGKWGSTQFADYINKLNVDLDLLINLDMVGFSPEETNDFLIEYDSGNVVQENDKYSLAVANFIINIAENHTDLNATLGLVGNSDYLPFEALGYTVIGLHDDGVTKNPKHHTTNDTPDLLDYEYLTSVTRLTLSTISGLDNLRGS
jgi:peptidase M28-like protein